MTTKKGESSENAGMKRHSEELPAPFLKALNEIDNKMSVATEPLREVYKVRRKPLPQILDEMDDNIRAAAYAAQKAEEAAKAGKQAAVAATQASNEAGKRAEEARLAGIKAAETATKAASDAASKAEAVALAAKAAAEVAARKAEEAVEAARAAAETFRKAAEEAVRKVETIIAASKKEAVQFKEAVQEVHTAEAKMLQRIKSLEERLATIEASLPSEKVILLREISKEDAEKEIRKLFSESKALYYSDIAESLRLDLQLVVEICNELQNRGEIEVIDDALRTR
jgi:Mg2+ and Co2+ transporter CorA